MILADKKEIKRLGIFFFYDKDGIVDDYITVLLEDMRRNISELLIVCNGKLTIEGRGKLQLLTTNLIVRENIGFDVWAYKEGMESYGWDQLAKYDEIILFNSTIFGPLYSFSIMFDEMDKRNVDFWGITKHHKIPFDPFKKVKYGYIPEHIQSHFIVIRQTMLKSYEFKCYWDNMPMIKSYDESIGHHEAIFTKSFSDKGYKWDVYVDTSDLDKHVYHPMTMMPLELIKNRKCPIIKRRSFFHPLNDFINNTTGEQTLEIYEYMKANMDFDLNLIWDNILRTCNQADIKNAMNLNYILSTTSSSKSNPNSNKKIALVLHIYFEDLIDYCLNYAKSMPPETDVYITTKSTKMKLLIEVAFKNMECAKLEVIVIENRGRDVSALLVGCKDFLFDYDYVCFAHDKKTTQIEPYIKGESFSYKCFENTLKNDHFVQNVINTFEENPRLGMLSPIPPNHADFYSTIGKSWTINYKVTKKLADRLKIKVDMDESKDAIAPLGTMFWFRPKALKTLIDCDWKYEDFPKEPNETDGTLLHAIERIYPFVAQHEGYYPAWVISDSFAKIEITNLYYMLGQINVQYIDKYGYTDHTTVVANLRRNFLLNVTWAIRLKVYLKKYLPRPIFNLLKRIKNLV